MPSGFRKDGTKLGFQKGCISLFKGKHHTKKAKEKMKKAKQGKYFSSNNPNWKGGRRINSKGYVWIKVPKGTPGAYKIKSLIDYMPEHRYVMSKHLNRPLNRNEVVHHIDEDRINNKLSNLLLLSISEHIKLHSIMKHQSYQKS
jgi:hypothetical protein